MRVKLDENIPVSAAEMWRQLGHDVDTVVDEGLRGAADREVAAVAGAAGRLLITLDRGLGDVRRYPPGTHGGILVLRAPNQSALGILSQLRSLAVEHDLDQLAGAVAVMQRGLLRIRHA